MINSIGLLYMYIFVLAGVIAFFWRLINKANKKVKPEYVYTPNVSLNKIKSINSNFDNKTNDDDSPKTNNKQLSHKKVGILTQNEYKFYDQLRVNLERRFNGAVNINLKIRLADLFTSNEKDNYQSYLNEIQSEHIDFVITDKITTNVILLIKFMITRMNEKIELVVINSLMKFVDL